MGYTYVLTAVTVNQAPRWISSDARTLSPFPTLRYIQNLIYSLYISFPSIFPQPEGFSVRIHKWYLVINYQGK